MRTKLKDELITTILSTEKRTGGAVATSVNPFGIQRSYVSTDMQSSGSLLERES